MCPPETRAWEHARSVRPLLPADTPQVLTLNARATPHVAPLDDAELARLREISRAHVVVAEAGVTLGYALVFAHDDGYDGEEFLLFKSLLMQPFTYIDQVVVSDQVRGMGVGRLLYRAIEQVSLLRGTPGVCCEVNTAPPNPVSLAFHARLGFAAIGALTTQDGRSVSLLHKPVGRSA